MSLVRTCLFVITGVEYAWKKCRVKIWFHTGARLYQFFNLAIASEMDALLGEEAFGLGRAGKVEGGLTGGVILV